MLALAFSISAVPVYKTYVNSSSEYEVSAVTNDEAYTSKFRSIALAKGYNGQIMEVLGKVE